MRQPCHLPTEAFVAAETVTVPDLPSAALLAVVKKEVGLTSVDDRFAGWDFVRDEQGKVYEVATWAPSQRVSSEAVSEHFAALGGGRSFVGNPAAFLQWVRTNRQDGQFVSIPEENRLFRGAGSVGFTPLFIRLVACRALTMHRVADDWDGNYVLVAFRECLK